MNCSLCGEEIKPKEVYLITTPENVEKFFCNECMQDFFLFLKKKDTFVEEKRPFTPIPTFYGNGLVIGVSGTFHPNSANKP